MTDLFKVLLLIYLIIFLLLGAPFVILRIVEVCDSEAGLWQTYPHSGFCPDSPSAPTLHRP